MWYSYKEHQEISLKQSSQEWLQVQKRDGRKGWNGKDFKETKNSISQVKRQVNGYLFCDYLNYVLKTFFYMYILLFYSSLLMLSMIFLKTKSRNWWWQILVALSWRKNGRPQIQMNYLTTDIKWKKWGLRMNTSESESRSVGSNSLQPDGLCSPWHSPGQNTGVGILSLLQATFPTQGSNPSFPHCRGILYPLSHKGSSKILEWAAYPFSSGSSRPRNWTRVSCIAGGFFTNHQQGPRMNTKC